MSQGTKRQVEEKPQEGRLPGRWIVGTSPHISSTESVEKIMWTVVATLMVPGAFGVWLYGWPALKVMLLSVAAAVATEAIIQKLTHQKITVADGSAVVTGLLFAYSISPRVSWFVPVFCSVFAIAVVKQAFGGLGNNIWNPAAASRAFALAAWPTITTALWIGGWGVGPDCLNDKYIERPSPAFQAAAVTGSTPRKSIRMEMDKARKGKMTDIPYDTGAADTLKIIRERNNPGFWNLLIGTRGGCIGESCIPALLLGGLVLIVKRYVNWQLPAAMIASALFFGWMLPVRLGVAEHSRLLWFSGDMLFDCLSGGLIIGAFFIATDIVTCPITVRGQVVFGLGCGFITAVIRLYAGFPEGVSYAVILMNSVTPIIDRYTQPKVFGGEARRR